MERANAKRLASSGERIAIKGRGRGSTYKKTCCEKCEEKCGESMDSRVSEYSAAAEHARVGSIDESIIFTLEHQRQTCNQKDRKTSYQLPGTDPELY